MSTLASERSWLMDPSLLKLVHQCRRLIRSEFGVKLRLTEEHLEEQLAEYASRTRSSHLARTWEALQEKVPQLAINRVDPDTGDAPKRMYRGQEVVEEAGKEDAHSEQSAEVAERKKKVIYRGQVIG